MAKAPIDLDTPGGRIRARRKELGLSMEQLANEVHVHFTTIAKWERAQRALPPDALGLIANALGVQPGDLVPGAAVHLPARMVPVLGKIAAGNWREAMSAGDLGGPVGYVPAPYGSSNAYALQPDGDSMDLIVPEGGIIVIDPDLLDLRDGGIYAVMKEDGEATFKRFRSDPPRLEPCSSNPVHQTMPLGREPFRVLGKVIWQGSPL
ncbi:repressor LexA [Sphingomonas sp. BE138]|uniref:LexA family protein n=1 Tax=Sphingomonas sp. BE138 TaxID=2817845 RepID=UPI0028592CDA|nr:S24 family peptidase [Sphingomonas sp. BE138]MDR6789555.1 repressor LexA [Sphingomonas sp. BE138]